jgi:hypothetical protein
MTIDELPARSVGGLRSRRLFIAAKSVRRLMCCEHSFGCGRTENESLIAASLEGRAAGRLRAGEAVLASRGVVTNAAQSS